MRAAYAPLGPMVPVWSLSGRLCFADLAAAVLCEPYSAFTLEWGTNEKRGNGQMRTLWHFGVCMGRGLGEKWRMVICCGWWPRVWFRVPTAVWADIRVGGRMWKYDIPQCRTIMSDDSCEVGTDDLNTRFCKVTRLWIWRRFRIIR